MVNALNIVHNQSTVGVIGATGTPTSVTTLPIFINASQPFIGPFTGGTAMRDIDEVVNVRPQYEDEVEIHERKMYTHNRLLQQWIMASRKDGRLFPYLDRPMSMAGRGLIHCLWC